MLTPKWMLLLLVGAVAAVLAAQGNSDFFGSASKRSLTVIDGDTLDLNGQPIELSGIDAPELGQWCLDGTNLYPCGLTAAFELNKLIELETVTCVPAETQTPSYECRTPNATLDVLLLEDGLVVATSGAQREMIEANARKVPLGIWRGPMIDPKAWREGERLPEEHADADTCPILAIDGEGSRTYVVPTDRDYSLIEADEKGVAHRFCSDEEARAAGFAHWR